MPDITDTADENGAVVPAMQVVEKDWLFPRFDKGSKEAERVKLSLGLFLITLILCAIFLVVGYQQQQEDYSWQIEKAADGLPLQLKDIKDQEYSADVLHTKGKNIFQNFWKKFNPNNPEEQIVLDALIEKYLRPANIARNFNDAQLMSQIVEYFKPITLKDYAILFYKPILIVWLIFGITYSLIIFALYRFGLEPAVGEPAFNIIDVGFLAVLIQYTGGLRNTFLLTYLFSLLLASFDFYFRKQDKNYRSLKLPTQLFIIVGPYAFSFILSVFWATYERVFLLEDNWPQYATVWLILLVSAGLIWTAFYIIIKHFYPKLPLTGAH